MFSKRSGNTSKQASGALRARVAGLFSGEGRKLVTISRLYSYTGAPSVAELVSVLTDMVKQGVLEQLVRVEFDGRPIELYDSILDVPPQLYDPEVSAERWVDPSDCKVVYRRAQ